MLLLFWLVALVLCIIDISRFGAMSTRSGMGEDAGMDQAQPQRREARSRQSTRRHSRLLSPRRVPPFKADQGIVAKWFKRLLADRIEQIDTTTAHVIEIEQGRRSSRHRMP